MKETWNVSGPINKIQQDMVIYNSNPSSKEDSEAGGLLELSILKQPWLQSMTQSLEQN